MDPDQTGQIQTAISEGEYYGMQTFDQALLKLIEEDRVRYEEALKVASRPQDFRLMVRSLGLGMASYRIQNLSWTPRPAAYSQGAAFSALPQTRRR